MVTTTKKQLWRLQETLYERAHADAIHLARGNSKTILTYAEEYESSLPSIFTKISKSTLLDKILTTDILLYGDFHTLKQSQKGLIRLMRELIHSNKHFILTMETFRECDNEAIKKYIDYELEEAAFLDIVMYDQLWGFPWSNFKVLLDFARKHKIEVRGVNTEKAGADSLKIRDEFTSQILVDLAQKNTDSLVICLIGEYHLSDSKLPAEINTRDNKANVLKIVTNIDHYFFELQKEGLTTSTQYLYLKDDLYCIMNVPPWMKWQSYTIWEESKDLFQESCNDFSLTSSDCFAEYNEAGYDVDYHFFSLCRDLINFLDIPVSESEISRFYINENLIGPAPRSKDKKSITASYRSSADGAYFDSNSQVVLTTNFSLNGMSESAGQFVYHITSGFNDTHGTPTDQFYRRIIKFAVGMLASRVFNPRRKCSNFGHAYQYLASTKNKRLNASGIEKRLVAKNVLKHHEWFLRSYESEGIRHALTSVYKEDEANNYSISRYIGLILGFNVYTHIVLNGAAHSVMKKIFLTEVIDTESTWETVKKLYLITLNQSDSKQRSDKKVS